MILDDVWAWRADHGTGVGWTQNTADTGLVVNGDDVTAYGLFVEHYQKDEVIWNGQNGEDIFFQNEMPYDPPSQAAWMESPTADGYPASWSARRSRASRATAWAATRSSTRGLPIQATGLPGAGHPGVQFHDLLTVFLNGSGGIESVVNGTGAPGQLDVPGPSTSSPIRNRPTP